MVGIFSGGVAAEEPEVRSGEAKKRKPARPDNKKKKAVKRETGPNCTIQEGEDMLLIISNTWTPKPRAPKKRKAAKSKASEAPNLPEEVLVKIFQFAVVQDGAVPFLCRTAQVCRAWNRAAAYPSLWRSVSIGRGGTESGTCQLPGMQRKEIIDWLARDRFSQLTEFSLFHWKSFVGHVVLKVAQSARLKSLTLSHCKTVTMNVFKRIGLRCRSLESLNVQNSEIHVNGLVSYLRDYATQIKSLCFTHGRDSDKILDVLYQGCCPELRLLEINNETDAEVWKIHIHVQALQIGCSKLQTFRLMNLTPATLSVRNTPPDTAGFPLLEELSIVTTARSTLSDYELMTLLHGSPCLRVLDLRGAVAITYFGLCRLPCENLECLYWGLYSLHGIYVIRRFHKVAMKWRNTLRELDLSNQPFSEEEMARIVKNLLQTDGVVSLSSLKLNGTTITPSTLRELISKAPDLTCLNVSSCQNLPRGLKRLYRDQENIHQLCEKLNSRWRFNPSV